MPTFRTLCAAVVATSLLSSASAQLAGTYTINASGSGARNFKTIKSAVYSLWVNGMSAAVTLELADGTYTEDVALLPLKGLSIKNPLTFRAANKHKAIWNATSTRAAALSTSYSGPTNPIVGVIIDGIRFARASSAVVSRTDSSDWEIENCHFTSGVSIGVSATMLRWNVHHNLFEVRGIGVNAGLANGCTISHNDFRLSKSMAISITTGANVLTAASRIFNNRIVGTLNTSSGAAAVTLAGKSFDVEFSHNTLAVSGSYSGSTVLSLFGAFARANKVIGNILVASGQCTCMEIAGTGTYSFHLSENLYFHRTSGVLIVAGGLTNYRQLSKWQAATGFDKGSVQGDPKFVSVSDPRLTLASPAIGKVKSSPMYVRDDFAGHLRFQNLVPDIGAYEFESTRVFGTGCQGTGGIVPQISVVGSPALGARFFILLQKAWVGASSAFLIVGASNQSWGSIPLPLRFGSGCDLLVSADLFVPMTVTAGFATFQSDVPNNSQLLGASGFFQWAVRDPAAKGIGQAFSPGVAATIAK